jgi:hypothetical protein
VKIGDQVIHQGRAYVLRGLDPMSVSDRTAMLEHSDTGERIHVPLEDVEPGESPSKFEPEGLG